ncbi:MAG TPA: selenide, water dikinase SelD [Verrucomicrobiales bacterium]|jgi:selenide,water dikinase|nr:selenide, water dikinase SelD [Verrucomicrobiales bacterium]
MSIRLTALSSCAGCAAKLPQAKLAQILRDLPGLADERLLVGASTSDDAAVYRLDATRALVQTVDFFTPIVDDPFLYGQIAATNALSDVYAMGGRPVTAMNLLGLPDEVDLDIAHTILRGGAEKVREAGCLLAGGHSIRIPEPVYGLSVTGLVHPERLITNAGGRAGDLLVLTKPLGTGIITTALKREKCAPALADAAVQSMCTLNTPGALLAERGLVRAGTDVTGFGLLGHLGSLCRSSGVSAVIHAPDVPVLHPEVTTLIAGGCIPGGTKQNLAHAEGFTCFHEAGPGVQFLLADAQTSGGLLLCVAPECLEDVIAVLEAENTLCQAVIGRLTAPGRHLIEVSI